jgi:hypothetical protein
MVQSNLGRRTSDNFIAIGLAVADDPLLVGVEGGDGRTLLMSLLKRLAMAPFASDHVRGFFVKI